LKASAKSPLRARSAVSQDLPSKDARPRPRDAEFDSFFVKVFPGEHYVTDKSDEMLVTVLGSCVAACVRDSSIGVGGMNHFMLPESQGGQWGGTTASLRYGNFAMEHLINEILKRGGRRSRLEIKVFGGGRILNNAATVGDRNAEFVEAYLKAEGLPIAARDLLGDHPRRVHYFPGTGKVFVREVRPAESRGLLSSEEQYLSRLKTQPVEGTVELF